MTSDNRQDIRKDVEAQYGAVSPMTGKETIKTNLFRFSREGVYLGVKLVQTYNEKEGRYNDEVPRITLSVDDKFVGTPMDGEWWADFAKAVGKVAEIMKMEKALAGAMKTMLGINPAVHLVEPKSIVRSEGKAVRVIDKRKI